MKKLVVIGLVSLFIVCSVFPGCTSGEQPPSINDKVDYVQKVWKIAETADNIKRVLDLPDPNSSIPFGSEIGGILTVISMKQNMDSNKYSTAAKEGVEWLLKLGLKEAGLSWLAAYVSVAEACYNAGKWLYTETQEKAFNAQITYYLQYREDNISEEEMLSSYTVGGWLRNWKQAGTFAPASNSGYTLDDVFSIGREFLKAKQAEIARAGDETIIRDSFVSTLGRVKSSSTSVPPIMTTLSSTSPQYTLQLSINPVGGGKVIIYELPLVPITGTTYNPENLPIYAEVTSSYNGQFQSGRWYILEVKPAEGYTYGVATGDWSGNWVSKLWTVKSDITTTVNFVKWQQTTSPVSTWDTEKYPFLARLAPDLEGKIEVIYSYSITTGSPSVTIIIPPPIITVTIPTSTSSNPLPLITVPIPPMTGFQIMFEGLIKNLTKERVAAYYYNSVVKDRTTGEIIFDGGTTRVVYDYSVVLPSTTTGSPSMPPVTIILPPGAKINRGIEPGETDVIGGGGGTSQALTVSIDKIIFELTITQVIFA